MALKREDLIIGSFIAVAVVYPFFIAFLIWHEDYSNKKRVLESLSPFLSFLVGSEDCSERNFERLKVLISHDLLQAYGEEGFKRLCEQSKKEGLKLKKESARLFNNQLEFYGIYEGKSGSVVLRLKARLEGEGITVREFSYEKGG